MTRPENRLYAFNHYSKGNFGELVHEALTSIATEDEINNTPLVIERGNKNELKQAASANLDSFYCPAENADRLWYPDIVLRAEQDGGFSTDEILYGNSFHLLMAQVNKLEGLDLKLTELIDDGKIDTSFKDRLEKEANGLLQNEIYARFIDNSHQIKSEQSIIVGPNEIKRPDKIIIHHDKVIVIDFKTGAKQAKHIDQAITYRGIMEEMFKLPIETYLYYSKDQALIVC